MNLGIALNSCDSTLILCFVNISNNCYTNNKCCSHTLNSKQSYIVKPVIFVYYKILQMIERLLILLTTICGCGITIKVLKSIIH